MWLTLLILTAGIRTNTEISANTNILLARSKHYCKNEPQSVYTHFSGYLSGLHCNNVMVKNCHEVLSLGDATAAYQ